MNLKEHPTVKAYLNSKKRLRNADSPLKSNELKAIAKECGADAAGLVDVQRETMKPYRKNIEWALPECKNGFDFGLGAKPGSDAKPCTFID